MIERSGSRSESIPLTKRIQMAQNMWIVDPVDLDPDSDPEHWDSESGLVHTPIN